MIIAARVCDAFETCITVEADKSVTVNPADLTDDEILDLEATVLTIEQNILSSCVCVQCSVCSMRNGINICKITIY